MQSHKVIKLLGSFQKVLQVVCRSSAAKLRTRIAYNERLKVTLGACPKRTPKKDNNLLNCWQDALHQPARKLLLVASHFAVAPRVLGTTCPKYAGGLMCSNDFTYLTLCQSHDSGKLVRFKTPKTVFTSFECRGHHSTNLNLYCTATHCTWWGWVHQVCSASDLSEKHWLDKDTLQTRSKTLSLSSAA